MKLIKGISIIALLITIANACEKVEEPIKPPNECGIDSFPIVDSAAMNRSYRKTLVEEFTGHKCITCPANTAQLLALQESNKKRMVVVAFHAGQFAAVELPKYPTDFNTEYGDQVHAFYEMSEQAIPSGIINKTRFSQFDDLLVFNNATISWNSPIGVENDNTDQHMALGVAVDYYASLDLLALRVSAEGLADLDGNFRLLTLCVEDSIIAEQLDGRLKEEDYPDKIDKEYAHRHVVRGKLSADQSIFGDKFIQEGISSGTWYDYTLCANVPANVEDINHVSIVVALIDEETEQVIQSEEVHLHVD